MISMMASMSSRLLMMGHSCWVLVRCSVEQAAPNSVGAVIRTALHRHFGVRESERITGPKAIGR